MKWITGVLVIVVAAALAYAGGPAYLGQVRTDMMLEKYSKAKIDSVIALPTLPPGKYRVTKDDYSTTVVVDVLENGTVKVEVMYPR